MWSLIDGAVVTPALQRTTAYYSPVDDLTRFDLHTADCRACAWGFVYGLLDQSPPRFSVFVSCTALRDTLAVITAL